jgi:hypothetical protein
MNRYGKIGTEIMILDFRLLISDVPQNQQLYLLSNLTRTIANRQSKQLVTSI